MVRKWPIRVALLSRPVLLFLGAARHARSSHLATIDPDFCRNGTFSNNCKLLCQLTLGLFINLPGVAQLNSGVIKFATFGWKFCKIGRGPRTQNLVFCANQYYLSLRNNCWGNYLLWLQGNRSHAGTRDSARKLLLLGSDGGAPRTRWCDGLLKIRFGCALPLPTTQGFARVIM